MLYQKGWGGAQKNGLHLFWNQISEIERSYSIIYTFRFIRRLQQEGREQEMQEKIVAAERERVLKQKQMAQEERLAKELEKRKWEQQRDDRIRQQIKENR